MVMVTLPSYFQAARKTMTEESISRSFFFPFPNGAEEVTGAGQKRKSRLHGWMDGEMDE